MTRYDTTKMHPMDAMRDKMRLLEAEVERLNKTLEAHKDTWLSWEAKRSALEAAAVERDALQAQLAAAQGQPEQCDHGTAWDTPCRACDDEQAQPERAPLSDAELEQEFCNIAGLETGINPAAADTKRALVWFKKGYAHGIKQGGQ